MKRNINGQPSIPVPTLLKRTVEIWMHTKSVVVPKSAKVGRSVDYQLTITSRLFTRLTMLLSNVSLRSLFEGR